MARRKGAVGRTTLLIAAALAAVAGFLANSRAANGVNGLPLDDCWIHLRYAQNLARGDGLSLNPGVPTPGATSPLWVALIAFLLRVGAPPVGAAQALAAAFHALAALASFDLARLLLPRRAALAAAALCAALPALVWSGAGGIEVGLFNFLALHALRLHLLDRGSRWRLALAQAGLLGLAAWARPEAMGLAAVLAASGAWRALVQPASGRSVGRVLAQAVCLLALPLAIAAPYSAFCWVTTGRPLPTTFYVKASAPFSPAFVGRCLGLFFEFLHGECRLLAPGALAAAASLVAARGRWRPVLPLLAWTLGLPVAYGVIGDTEAGANFGRHFYIAAATAVICGVAGWRWLAAAAGRRLDSPAARRWALRVALAAMALDMADALVARARLFALNVSNIQHMQVRAAKWVVRNVPPGRRLAVNDIGAISFFADRPVIDLRGIATPAILPYLERYGRPGEATRDSGALVFIRRVRPDYLLVFPEWYPRTLAALEREGVLRREATFSIDDNVTCGSDTLLAARLSWRKARRSF